MKEPEKNPPPPVSTEEKNIAATTDDADCPFVSTITTTTDKSDED